MVYHCANVHIDVTIVDTYPYTDIYEYVHLHIDIQYKRKEGDDILTVFIILIVYTISSIVTIISITIINTVTIFSSLTSI